MKEYADKTIALIMEQINILQDDGAREQIWSSVPCVRRFMTSMMTYLKPPNHDSSAQYLKGIIQELATVKYIIYEFKLFCQDCLYIRYEIINMSLNID